MIIRLEPKISNFLNTTLQSTSTKSPTYESESYYSTTDLLCEGPIEGFTNKNGETVGYLELNGALNSIGTSIYYNNIPVVDSRTNLFNYAQTQISFDTGTETKKGGYVPTSVFEYKNRIYDIPKAILIKNKIEKEPSIYSNTTSGFVIETFKSNDLNISNQLKNLLSLKNYSNPVSHRIANRYSSYFKFNISIDNLYSISGNDTAVAPISFIIEAQNLTTQITSYLYFNGSFIAKGGSLILPFEIFLDNADGDFGIDRFPDINIVIYSLRESVLSSTSVFRTFSLDSVVECVQSSFSYPYSCVVNSTISSRHFNGIPTRSYDCKLLKIRVPDTYDGEAREYTGNWSGNFNVSLKWTNNPAWIFYDLCINSRYGMGRGHINEVDLDKWQFLTLSKFCDELIKTNSRTKYSADSFLYNNDIKYGEIDYNTITFTTTETNLKNLQNKYPLGSILFLYDIKNKSDEIIEYNYKKIICSVSLNGSTATIKLCNDFGPRKILESDISGNLFSELMKYVKAQPDKNTESQIKLFILKYIIGDTSLGLGFSTQDETVSKNHMKLKIFDNSLNVFKGYCVAKHPEFEDYLEPRFSCNVLINNDVEGLKTLSDLASIFRGIFYFKNGLLSLTSDVKQKPVYIFTNSNVKDGLFTYASSDLNTSFSVARVPYLDKNDNFKDKIVYVEDQDLIRKYGIVEKDILSFGITNRSEAQRIGRWYLATGKLESEIVGFSTGLEATFLQIGNVIRISDSLKNSSIIYGKIIDLDFINNYIYIDREISQNAFGKIIKIFSIVNNEPYELNYSVAEVDNVNLKLKLISERYFSWKIVSGITTSNNNKTLTSVSTLGAAWNKKAFTNESYINNCQIIFTVGDTSSQSAVGISEVNNINTSYTDITYRFRFNGSDVVAESDGSTVYSATASVKITDIFKIIYDGEYVRYYKNNELLASTQRSVKNKLYGVVALNGAYASINNLYYTHFPDDIYGTYSELRSGANFSIYVNDEDSKNDLFKIISINEVSSNEYAISAMKYQEEKFNIIENNKYIDKSQNKPNEIIFSNNTVINELFTDAQIATYISSKSINYTDVTSTNYDYSFLIEQEVLNYDFFNAQYEYLIIDFISMFNNLIVTKRVENLLGIMCIINRNGKTLNFNILKEDARFINIFLGESYTGNISAKTSIDLYAFDLNYKIINV